MRIIVRYIIGVSFFIINIFSLYGQYVNTDGDVNIGLIISKLEALPWGSPAQDSAINLVLYSLKQETKSHSILLDNEDKRGKVLLSMRNLAMRVGDFYFLNPHSKKPKKVYNAAADTVTSQVKEIRSKWNRILDSITIMTTELKTIIEDENHSYRTKDEACHILINLSKIDTNIIDYFLTEVPQLINVTPEMYLAADCLECERSALRSLFFHYTGWTTSGSNDRNFAILPYMIKYWGDPDWEVQSITDVMGNKPFYAIEGLSFTFLTRGYNKPWLLFEWILANAKDPNTPILLSVGENVEKWKEIYYANPENKGE